MFSNKYASFTTDQGILFCTYFPTELLDLAAAEKIVADRLRFQEEKEFPVYCDLRRIKDTEKAARDFMAKEGTVLTTAVALHIDSFISKAISDFYLQVSQPEVPTEVFSEEYDALRFLRRFRKN